MGICAMSLTAADEVGAVSVHQADCEGALRGITVAIVSARGLRNADNAFAGKSDCFCVLKVADGKSSREEYRTKVRNDTLCPVWKEEALLHSSFLPGQRLEFSCWDEDLLGMKDHLGQVALEYSEVASEGFNGELRLKEAGKGILAYLRVKVRLPGEGYPAGPWPEVKATLAREPGTRWGMSLDCQDGNMLFIDDTEDGGPVRTYNETVEPALQLRPGDYIAGVNGDEGDVHGMLELFKSQDRLELLVRHSEEFCATVRKPEDDQTLSGNAATPLPGLVLRRTPNGTCLVVAEVMDSWQTLKEDAKVMAKDRIVAVGETRGGADDLMKALATKKSSVLEALATTKSSDTWEVTFLRPAALLPQACR